MTFNPAQFTPMNALRSLDGNQRSVIINHNKEKYSAWHSIKTLDLSEYLPPKMDCYKGDTNLAKPSLHQKTINSQLMWPTHKVCENTTETSERTIKMIRKEPVCYTLSMVNTCLRLANNMSRRERERFSRNNQGSF